MPRHIQSQPVTLFSQVTLGVTFALISTLVHSTAQAQVSVEIVAEQVEEVAAHLVGVMDTATQATNNAEKVEVRMTTCRVSLAETNSSINTSDAIFLYQEQALAQSLDKPYRQRFLRLAPSANNRAIESQSLKPINSQSWIGFCNQPQEQRIVSISTIVDANCSVFLLPVEDIYVGKTQPGGCPTNFRGAVTITNTIILHSEGMDTWDRGFDEQGNQIWGAQNEAYQYRWQEPKQSTIGRFETNL